ncbi:MAG: type II toxin-antitoxin system Phd/YefM family antitoxin [Thermodesulfobacteriota bacterium]
MKNKVSKSKFKAHALEYFREIEKSKEELVITDRGKPVLKIVPFHEDMKSMLNDLKGTVLKYDKPAEPINVEWDVLK